jgi:hypothetical protein
MPPRSLEPDQTAKLVERLANKCGKTVPSRLILEFIKARTLNRTLPLAARSNTTAGIYWFEYAVSSGCAVPVAGAAFARTTRR